jgi:hypothetical protein
VSNYRSLESYGVWRQIDIASLKNPFNGRENKAPRRKKTKMPERVKGSLAT